MGGGAVSVFMVILNEDQCLHVGVNTSTKQDYTNGLKCLKD